MVSLKVDNLSYRITPEDLKPIFERYGEVGDIYIPRDRFTKESRGFSFVRYLDKRDAEDAMDKMDGYVLDGREMRVQTARYGRPSEPPHIRYGDRYVSSGYVFYINCIKTTSMSQKFEAPISITCLSVCACYVYITCIICQLL